MADGAEYPPNSIIIFAAEETWDGDIDGLAGKSRREGQKLVARQEQVDSLPCAEWSTCGASRVTAAAIAVADTLSSTCQDLAQDWSALRNRGMPPQT